MANVNLNISNTLCILVTFLYFTVPAQSIYVDLKIQKYSTHISKFTKSEMETKLKDTILNPVKRYSLIKPKPKISFDRNTPHDYIAEIEVIDTILQGALTTKINGRIYRQNIAAASSPPLWWFMASYTDRDGIVENEEVVLDNYFSWIPIHLNHCLDLIPNQDTLQLQALNLPQDSVSKMESFREVVVSFDYPVEIELDSIINQMFKDVLHKQQEFYWAVRSQRKGFFNLYEKPEEGFTDNPMQIIFSVLREGNSYKIRLVTDKNNTLLKTSMLTVPEWIEFSHDQLVYAQPQVMERINNLLGSIFRLNLD